MAWFDEVRAVEKRETSVAMSKRAMGIGGLTVVMALSIAGCASGAHQPNLLILDFYESKV